jgi:magnesium transporter
MTPVSPIRPRHPIRVVLSPTALLPFVSVQKAAALPIAQLGVAAFFVAGVIGPALQGSGGWFVLAATLVAVLVRAIDIESWALLIPGGLESRAMKAFGPRGAGVAAASALVERLLLGAVAGVLVGHYTVSVAAITIAGFSLTGYVRPEDLAAILAVAAVGILWIRIRTGREIDRDGLTRAIWIGVGILVLTVAWGVMTLARNAAALAVVVLEPPPIIITRWPFLDALLAYVFAFGLTLPVIGGGDALARTAHTLPLPRVHALRRIAALSLFFALVVTTLGTFLVVTIVPPAEQLLWVNAPLVGLVQRMAGTPWMRDLLALALAGAAVCVLLPVADSVLHDAEQILIRSSTDGILPRGFSALHSRFSTPARAIDVTTAAVILIIVVSGGRMPWLARAYGMAIAVQLLLTIAALGRLRRTRKEAAPFTTPMNLRVMKRQIPVGLLVPFVIIAASVLGMLVAGDVPSIAAGALIVASACWFVIAGRQTSALDSAEVDAAFDLLPTTDVSPHQIGARPGNVLVPVRNPHSLAHVLGALHAAGDRDVVVMTVRLLDLDVREEEAAQRAPTVYESRLLSEVVALAEGAGRPVHLIIVPARNVVDAIAGAVIRLRASEVYVGESSTLSAEDQARLLGEAWERADKPETFHVRLVIYHRSGRTDTYHLGPHPPSLTSSDLDLIHRLWLDAVKAIGPHVHHHDVVRAALTQMEQQLTGPNRDEALAAIQQVAQLAEELAAILRARDYARLRDILRNRHANDVAGLLTALTVEDQVVVFRVLPRKDAAAVFEYLSHDAKEALLKAMAQEDVAALLNTMAPDDRTLFLEELPAEATRQLLALLTPAERTVAVTLLGYPEQSVGRLMTPHYVAVREQWTVREVLDYVRTHGQDSETLNHVYVVENQGLLIDDIRMREFLLAPLDNRVADLMDRQFVALKATDTDQDAVAVFRRYDRTALPVTDTSGMLIGIVTIDDVLDVAEAAATREIQRIGGSEALDEPYISIAFGRMIQKRAGWLTALFLGEMLTATAMGAFEAEISKAVVLALFVPLIISSGGNSGSQAATLVIRALALGEVTVRDWWRVMRREILAGLALGVILGSIGFLRITLWSAFSDIYGPHWLLVAITVALALVGVVLWGTLSGSLLPFVLKRLGFDPAASSAPFVATLVDVTGLVIYFSVALVVLRGTLL